MKVSWKVVALFLLHSTNHFCLAQEDGSDSHPTLPKEQESCKGIFIMYNFISREKEYPREKNATVQSWAFNSSATILNMGTAELKAWKIFIKFQYKEILVSADGAVLTNSDDFPAPVGNGTYLSGYPQSGLETSIDTANDFGKIQAKVKLKGTQFFLMSARNPMPETIELVNDGYKYPSPTHKSSSMYVCCVEDKRLKANKTTTKCDLLTAHDVTQAYVNNYLVQVTIENKNALGRLDHWKLKWEWTRGEFIDTHKGAYNPIIFNLLPEKANNTRMRKIPYCCKNGTPLPTTMDGTKSKSAFQMQVYKLPPDLNRTVIYPPQKCKIVGVLNPYYKCGSPVRVEPFKFPDPSGLEAVKPAIASWQIVCNISRPTTGNFRWCVTFLAYYNKSVIPSDTCACGCEDTKKCNPSKRAMLLPPEALVVPFENSDIAVSLPSELPATAAIASATAAIAPTMAAITVWFTALQFKKAGSGYESMDIRDELSDWINEWFGPERRSRVPRKLQSVITFKKKGALDIAKGYGFPSRVYFNGEECALPSRIPSSGIGFSVDLLKVFVCKIVSFLLVERLN
ncbi:putative Late embryoproteinsis abundant hydroxyproline-rich glycoprotein family [Hibiscus syriacus]|uniref:Late embryoproteinsis abundant hydroxyproline-rich glycoprotein family n=1 Tax=Hibiscus syriacus TaxID=106335 RepID=A0A6A2ZD82_HIBSY|nr:putative Late embryoproteinsis abundant hydroxyproline-rich glycoprotein family [Hibiscus syriacus]